MSDDLLWDDWGTPRYPHVNCPICGDEDADEVGSHFDHAWCCTCGWHGSLTEMRAGTIVPPPPFVPMSIGYVEPIGNRQLAWIWFRGIVAILAIVLYVALSLGGVVVAWLVSR